MTKYCSDKAYDVYKTFVKGECVITDCRTAELSKLAENSFRDINIAYANELSIISDELGINVRDLIKLANKHPRVNILSPGAGVGGHCIAVDPWFIVHSSPKAETNKKTAREINDYKPKYVIDRINNQISFSRNKHQNSPFQLLDFLFLNQISMICEKVLLFNIFIIKQTWF